MAVSRIDNPRTTLFFYDCEVDHKDMDKVNITEVCASKDNPYVKKGDEVREEDKKPYFVGYVKKSEHANFAGPYQKPIGQGERWDFWMVLKKIASFISKNTVTGSISALMGYNVEGWDAPVLEKNMNRFPHPNSLINDEVQQKARSWKWVDLAKIAHFLGYPMGTTQQQLEFAICAEHLPFNRHRAHADVKVVKQIWRKLTEAIEGDQEKERRVNEALAEENAEQKVAEILQEYDPSLVATSESIEAIQAVKKAEKLARKEIVVLFDLETTGLFPEANKETAAPHNVAPRVVEFAAKILSPFKGTEYNETFTRLVKVGSIPEQATKVHGITTEMVMDAPSMGEVWKDFEAWVRTTNVFKKIIEENVEGELEPKIVLVGYNNVGFDNPLLNNELLRCGIDLKRELDRGVKDTWDARFLMSTWFTGLPKDQKPENQKLQTLAQFFGIQPNAAHRALSDVETLEQILRHITNLEPSHVIVEMMKEKIHLTSPGVGAKEIIRETEARLQEIIREAPGRVASQEEELQAIRDSIQSYLSRKKRERGEEAEEKDAPVRKRARKEEKEKKEPETQEFQVPSQNASQPFDFI